MAVTAEEILDVIAKEVPLDPARLDPSARIDELDIGSMDMVSLMTALEEKYGIGVDQTDLARAETLQDFLDVVVQKVQTRR